MDGKSLNSIPEPNVLLSSLTTNEAVFSSRIEGTQATLEDVYEFEVSPNEKTPRYEDIQEIINYRRAITEASEKLNKLPLSSRLIREIHKTLLSGTRGKNKTPGNFRTGQVYIGQIGKDIESAASRILRILAEKGILELFRKGSGRKPSLYIFPELLKIIK